MLKTFLSLVLCFLALSLQSAYSYNYDAIYDSFSETFLELEGENLNYDHNSNLSVCCKKNPNGNSHEEIQGGSFFAFIDFSNATKGGLPDNAIACRGGSCTAERFSKGSGVKPDGAGKLNGISVNSAGGKSLKELTQGIPHNKVGVTTVGDVRKAGGNVVSSPTRNNPNHATMSGVTAKQAEKLMNPTVKNPSK